MTRPRRKQGQATDIDLDPPAQRALARRLAEESVVLLANDGGALPLAPAGREAAIRAGSR